MIIGVGLDLCDIHRFTDVVHRASPLFYERLLSELEREHFENIQNEETRVRWLAGVFAAKEAVLKATGTGIDGRYSLNSINTIAPSGYCRKIGLPASILEHLGENVQCHLAVSFSKKMAIAFAVLEK